MRSGVLSLIGRGGLGTVFVILGDLLLELGYLVTQFVDFFYSPFEEFPGLTKLGFGLMKF